MLLWIITHRAGEPSMEDHFVTPELAEALREIAQLWGPQTAQELGTQIVTALGTGAPTRASFTVFEDPVSPLATGFPCVVELRTLDTTEREWFGCLTRE